MRNKWLKLFIFIIIIVLVGGGFYILRDRKMIGKEIDSYKNVDIYYNGIIYTKAYGKNYSEDGYYYGQKWQCVEYIKRFYHQAKEHKMPDVYGNAKDFFDSDVPQGELNKRRDLVQYRNGGNVKPEPDDLIVFTDTNFGHVAIVTEVTSDYVEVIQQNVYGKKRERYELITKENQYYIGAKRKPAGWLRKE
ncbi:CHAP domain-containing protein [Clostridium sp.]|uniref:CHAP domain-containing protein n=1 Tax=Clostridium sp. TaxID=1506 RepID=UPI001A365F78|nr:CHAP domain-containing protein [Clostridium sp.]MBK5237476.1 CHAP domain-containing protein [Clostridium sp.]